MCGALASRDSIWIEQGAARLRRSRAGWNERTEPAAPRAELRGIALPRRREPGRRVLHVAGTRERDASPLAFEPAPARPFAIATALSFFAHAVALGILIWMAPALRSRAVPERIPITLIPASPLPVSGERDGAPGRVVVAPAPPPVAADVAPTSSLRAAPKPLPKKAVRPSRPPVGVAPAPPAAVPAAAAPVPAPAQAAPGSDPSAGAAIDVAAVGPGGGGGVAATGVRGGSSSAMADYAASPKPPYPRMARRMRQEGLVLLRVRVMADGRVGEVELQRSSGSDLLDDSALRTVRDAWRFRPAHAGGVAVESVVQVPLRFRLDETR